jgi:hypothetical protein
VWPPLWIASLNHMDCETFHYIEHQLLQMQRSPQEVLHTLQGHGVYISRQAMSDAIKQIIQIANFS